MIPKSQSQLSTELLSLLPRDVADSLDSLSKALSRIIGQIKRTALTGNDEFEGVSGLTRQIDYQRLLISEWGILNHAPLEFMRRAAMGEHLFLDRQRTTGEKASQILVLFNTGPEQLGAPRILHMALWLLMLRRCEAANADFRWGFIQAGPDSLSDRCDKHALIKLLEGRTTSFCSQQHLDKWKEYIDTADWAEIWLIGIEPTGFSEFPSSRISIQESWPQSDNQIQVEVAHRKQARKMSVTLPDQQMMLRLLRNPLEERRAEIASTDENFTFVGTAGHGRRAIYRQKDANKLKIVPLPNSASAKPGKPRFFTWDENQQIIAINITKKRFCAITESNDSWFLHRFPGMNELKTFTKNQHIETGGSLGNLAQFKLRTDSDGQKSLHLIDAKHQVRKLLWQDTAPLWSTSHTNILAKVFASNINLFVSWDKSSSEVVIQWDFNNLNTNIKKIHTDQVRPPKVLAHGSGDWNANNIGALAIGFENNTWDLYGRGSPKRVSPNPALEVIGVVSYGQRYVKKDQDSLMPEFGPKLVLLDTQRTQLIIQSENQQHVVYVSDVPIQSVTLCEAQLNIHMVTQTNEHRIYSLLKDELIYRQALGSSL